jgi:hypothetical protein
MGEKQYLESLAKRLIEAHNSKKEKIYECLGCGCDLEVMNGLCSDCLELRGLKLYEKST